jgi:hypothetical protein
MTTRLQQSLRARLRELHEQEELWSAFAKAWAVECETGVPADAAALLEDCLGQGAFDVLGNILGLAPKLGKLAGGRAGTPEALQQVAIGICLVACERRVQEKFAAEGIGPGGEAGAGAADEMLIAASEQLAAAVIAAAWCENGVRIRFDEQTRTAEAINVLRDVPPLELDFRGHGNASRPSYRRSSRRRWMIWGRSIDGRFCRTSRPVVSFPTTRCSAS